MSAERTEETTTTRTLSVAARKLRPAAGRTLNLRRLMADRKSLPVLEDEPHWRPKTRAECVDLPRPCPYVGCRHHLALDVRPNGSILVTSLDPTEMDETCSLDLADRGGMTLDEVGVAMLITRERVRQIECSAFGQIKGDDEMRLLAEGGVGAGLSPWDELAEIA